MVIRVLFITVDEAQPDHVSPARKVSQGREKEDALVQILPADVHQAGIKVAHVHIQRILDFACLLERADGEARPLLRRERLVPLHTAATVPEKHTAAVERPYRFLWRPAIILLTSRRAVACFSREEENVLDGSGATREETEIRLHKYSWTYVRGLSKTELDGLRVEGGAMRSVRRNQREGTPAESTTFLPPDFCVIPVGVPRRIDRERHRKMVRISGRAQGGRV